MTFTISFDLVTAEHPKMVTAWVVGVIVAQDRDDAIAITRELAKGKLIVIKGSETVEETL